MDYASLRAEGKKRLAGKYKQVIFAMIVFGLVVGLISYIPSLTKTTEKINYFYFSTTVTKDNAISVTLTLVAEVISLVCSFGIVAALWKVYKGETIQAADGLKLAFANWKRSLFILINAAKKLLIPLIMIVASMYVMALVSNFAISAIGALVGLAGSIWFVIAGLHYVLIFTIAADEPSLSEEAVVNKSKELMTNKRGKYVVLSLSFFGWILLGIITLGIYMLWLAPWMQFATFAFYEKCKGVDSTTTNSEANAE